VSLADAIEAAVMAKVGHVASEAVPDEEVTYETLRELFGNNADIATAAGYGRPGQHKKGSEAWKRRRTLMRNLQRYEKERTGAAGQKRTPTKLLPRLRSIAKTEQRRRATPRSVSDVIRLMGREGTTSTLLLATFGYSSSRNPARRREIDAVIYTRREVYRRSGWPMRGRVPRDADEWQELGEAYLMAWGEAYGMGGDLPASGVDETPVLLFEIGRGDGVQYEFS
jgi:hypothetical protein